MTVRILTLLMLVIFAGGNTEKTWAAEDESPVSKTHALAMHGDPALDPGFASLPYANPDAPKGGALTHCAIGTFDTLNDNTLKGKAAEGLHLINDPLMRRSWDEPFTLYGLIAKEVTIPEDRSFIAFHIDPEARFHDGSPVTASDVRFSFETLKTHGKPNTRRVYALVETVTVDGDYTIRFDFGPGYDRETALILAMMPVLSQAAWAGRDFAETTMDPPAGNGPYRIAAIDPGRSITYERVEDYWAANRPVNRGHFNAGRITYDYYRDQAVALEAFKSGACDLRREGDPAAWAVSYTDNGGYIRDVLPHGRPEPARGFIFNTRREPLNDPEVRRALALAFDFEWMNRTLLHAQARRITSTFPNTSLAGGFEWPTMDRRERLRAADQILNDAGWPIRNGKRFSLSLILNAPAEEKIALGYARDLKRLGIDLSVRTLDTAQFFGALNDYDYDMVSWRWINTLSPGTEQAVYWGCAAAQTPGSRNYAGLCDPAIDAAIDSLTRAKTRDGLEKAARHLDSLVMNAYPFVPLHYTGTDMIARYPHIARPERNALYGVVLETWWRDQTR